jgi:hypothetical protein
MQASLWYKAEATRGYATEAHSGDDDRKARSGTDLGQDSNPGQGSKNGTQSGIDPSHGSWKWETSLPSGANVGAQSGYQPGHGAPDEAESDLDDDSDDGGLLIMDFDDSGDGLPSPKGHLVEQYFSPVCCFLLHAASSKR